MRAYDKSIDRHVPVGPNGEQVVMAASFDLIPVDPAQQPMFDPPAFLHILDAFGTVEVVTAVGTTREYPFGTFAPGVTHPLLIKQVLAGTDSDTVLAAVRPGTTITFDPFVPPE